MLSFAGSNASWANVYGRMTIPASLHPPVLRGPSRSQVEFFECRELLQIRLALDAVLVLELCEQPGLQRSAE